MKVVFVDGRVEYFEADNWSFADVDNKNVYLDLDRKTIVHLNWSHVLYVEKAEKEEGEAE